MLTELVDEDEAVELVVVELVTGAVVNALTEGDVVEDPDALMGEDVLIEEEVPIEEDEVVVVVAVVKLPTIRLAATCVLSLGEKTLLAAALR